LLIRRNVKISFIYIARIPWENKYYEVLTDIPNIIKCKICPRTYRLKSKKDFMEHLYDKHQISELTCHPNRGFLEENFNIYVKTKKGRCKAKTCPKLIPYKGGMYNLENHYEMFHSNNANLFSTVVKIENVREILNNFILMGMEAVCISCELQFNIEHLDIHTADTLINLAEHYFSHNRYEDNFFIFD